MSLRMYTAMLEVDGEGGGGGEDCEGELHFESLVVGAG